MKKVSNVNFHDLNNAVLGFKALIQIVESKDLKSLDHEMIEKAKKHQTLLYQYIQQERLEKRLEVKNER